MSRKTENAIKAKEWVDAIEADEKMKQAIAKSRGGQKFWRKDLYTEEDVSYVRRKALGRPLRLVTTEETTHEVIMRLVDENYMVCALNFASYYNPGGGFLKGSFAQEESLCSVSGLYPIIKESPVYRMRRLSRNTPSWYRDEVIYSPGVPFVRKPWELGDIRKCDVISVAAPNCNRVPVSKMDELQTAVETRLRACYVRPYLEGCNALILGAWGCGVFKNSPNTIATTMSVLNGEFGAAYDIIVFALPNKFLRKIFEDILFN